MRKKSVFIGGIIAATLAMPNAIFAEHNIEINSNIEIDLEKTSIILGDKSKISISFKEKQNADSITINFLCYDQKLSAILNYNLEKNAYEGEINFNVDPEYLNVWEIENIVVNNSEDKQILDRDKLEALGLNLEEYKITQEYIIESFDKIDTYVQKTSAPIENLGGNTKYDTSVSVSKKGWPSTSKKVVIVNGDIIADGITATPLATTYDAPILIVSKESVPQVIKDEIKRLNPEEIIVIGGTNTISNQVYNTLASTANANMKRIWGQNRHETSLKIAQAIDSHHDVNNVFIANGFEGDIDALTIAAKAGQDKQPVILTQKSNIPSDAYTWMKSEKLTNAYFIGGPDTLDTEVIHKMANIVSVSSGQSVYKNRIYGADRHETNAKVIEKFYPQLNLNAMLVARSDELTDALIAGPLAAKMKSPILITDPNYLSSYHNKTLEDKSANVVYEIGNVIKDSIIRDIAYKLSKHNSGDRMVVIDAGHGGSDPGKVHGNTNEKVYTLDVSMATTEYLRKNNINVIMTRESDKTMALASRTSLSNSIQPDLLASIHFNAFNDSANGVEVYYRHADRNGGPTKTAASNVINSILETFKLRNRGIKTRLLNDGSADYLHIIRESEYPSILIECAFMDSPTDIPMIDEVHERKNMGIQIGKGIVKTVK